MNVYMKRILATIIVLIPVFLVLLLWLTMMPISSRFTNLSTTLLSIGRISSLVGLSLYSLSLMLHVRITFLLKIMDGPYIATLHHGLGSWALVFLLIHPLALASRFISLEPYYAARFLLPFDNLVNLAGFLALMIMIVAMLVTYYYKNNHTLWLWIHRSMLLAFVGALLHLLFVTSDVSASPILKYYLIFLMATGLLAFTYQRVSRL